MKKHVVALVYLLVAWGGLISAGMEFTYQAKHWMGWMFADLAYCALCTTLFLDIVKPPKVKP